MLCGSARAKMSTVFNTRKQNRAPAAGMHLRPNQLITREKEKVDININSNCLFLQIP